MDNSEIAPELRHLLLVMGMSSAMAKAFSLSAQQRGWPPLDPTRTEQAFAVLGPLMLSGLPQRETVEQLDEPFPGLYLKALSFCQSLELGEGYSQGAARLPAWAFSHIHGRLPDPSEDAEFLKHLQDYFGAPELRQLVAAMAKGSQ